MTDQIIQFLQQLCKECWVVTIRNGRKTYYILDSTGKAVKFFKEFYRFFLMFYFNRCRSPPVRFYFQNKT